jgi:hypothetical protein
MIKSIVANETSSQYAVLVDAARTNAQVSPVIAWGLDEGGTVVGLIAWYRPYTEPRLCPVNAIAGWQFDGYQMLTNAEALALKQKGQKGTAQHEQS